MIRCQESVYGTIGSLGPFVKFKSWNTFELRCSRDDNEANIKKM